MKYELIEPRLKIIVDALVEAGVLEVIKERLDNITQGISEIPLERREEYIKSNVLKPRVTAMSPVLGMSFEDSAKRTIADYPKYLSESAAKYGEPAPSGIDSIPSGADLYLNNGKAIEHNIEEISRTAFGFVEEKKLWGKELKLAVKEHGHDEVLSGFYNWCENNSNFKGTKPVGLFLKNVASNIGFVRKAPGFSNPNLDYVIKEIGYLTDNKVMFWGNTRAVLAKSIQEHGVENVLEAWRKFYNEDDNPSFAANGFISQIDILVYNVNKRKKEAANAQLAIEAAYRDAQATVQTEPEEELEEL